MPSKQRQKIVQAGNVVRTGTLTASGADTRSGTQTSSGDSTGRTAAAVVATTDGLTTGLLTFTMGFATVVSSVATKIVTLPACVAADAGKEVNFQVGTNGCEVRTPATGGATINDVDSDGTNEAAIPADTTCKALCVAADTWILTALTKLGAVVTAIVPDAA